LEVDEKHDSGVFTCPFPGTNLAYHVFHQLPITSSKLSHVNKNKLGDLLA